MLDGAASLVDLGSGAGFPGLVLKLARPHLTLTLVEAREKKAAFLEYLVSRLRLTGVEVVQTHLTPSLARKWEPKVDAVVSRAAFYPPPPAGVGRAVPGPGRRGPGPQGCASGPGRTGDGRVCLPLLGLDPLEHHKYHLPISGEPRLLVMCRKL